MALVSFSGDRGAYDRALNEAKQRSKTALDILAYLDASRDFDVIVLENGENYGQMLTDQDRSGDQAEIARGKYQGAFSRDAIARPTVLWNPYYEFEYYGDVTGVRLEPNGEIYAATLGDLTVSDDYVYKYASRKLVGGKWESGVTKVPVVRATRGMMPAWLVLMHELGHVKQFFEGNGEDAWGKRLGDVAGIEAENLEKHEIPICKDIGIPPREHYKHMKFGFEAVSSTYRPENKKPALRIAATPGARLQEDSWLFWKAKANGRDNATEGFFLHPA